MSKTPTPRTDYAERMIDVAFVGADGTSSAPEPFVEPDFARELERELAAMCDERDEAREEAATLRRQMDAKIEDFLNERACCNGQDCGCMGVSRLEQFVGEEIGVRLNVLRKERDELRAWKESALLVESRWDCQRVAKLLGLRLGDDIRPSIEPKIRELLNQLGEFKASEHLLHERYMRICQLVGAFDTNEGGENRFEVTEDKIRELLADKARLDWLELTADGINWQTNQTNLVTRDKIDTARAHEVADSMRQAPVD